MYTSCKLSSKPNLAAKQSKPVNSEKVKQHCVLQINNVTFTKEHAYCSSYEPVKEQKNKQSYNIHHSKREPAIKHKNTVITADVG